MSTMCFRSGTKVCFKLPIARVVYLQDKIVVMLAADIDDNYPRNVFCYTDKGELLWQVGVAHPDAPTTPYYSIYLEGEKFFVYSKSYAYLTDVNTGETLAAEWTK